MNTVLKVANPAEVETECLVVAVVDAGEKDKNEPRLLTSDGAVRAAAAELLSSGEFGGKIFETAMLYRPAGLKARRLLLVGGGKQKNFSAYELRKVAGTAVRFLKPKKIRTLAMVAPDTWGEAAAHSMVAFQRGVLTESVKAVVEGAYVADFDPDTYKSDRKDQSMQELTVVAPEATSAKGEQTAERGGKDPTSAKGGQTRGTLRSELESALEQGRIVGESQNFTRELVNEPGNRLTPTMLAQRASEMVRQIAGKAEGFKLSVETHGGDWIREQKMGAFWSVAQGSDEDPKIIIIRYEPEGAPEKPVLGLVGKGITFDSGGISIKPSDGMEKMKYDMAGGAAMLGAMRAIALLKPKVRVTMIVCASENMPSGKAQKPGDVQIAMSGKSIEIINTDAEGRLVLADGLHYARQLGCTHLIDAATLTGACVVALGYVNAGVFSNDEEMYERFQRALGRAGEKMWRLPLDEEYREVIRSGIADIVNSGGRWGGAVTAAMFLKEFVEDTPWIHLDIAGTAWMEENKAWIAKGPSGIGVRSLVEWVRGFAEGGHEAQQHADRGPGL